MITHQDVVVFDRVTPLVLLPEIGLVRSAKRFHSKRRVLGQKFRLLLEQRHPMDEKESFLSLFDHVALELLNQHGGDEGLAGTGSKVNDGVLFDGFVQQLDLIWPGNFRLLHFDVL